MSVVIARDPSVADQIVHAWPEPVPWGAELVCRDDEVAIVCPEWTVSEQLGPGRHKLSIPNRSAYVLVYFVRTTPFSAPFDHHLPVFDRTTSSVAQIHYTGSVLVKVGDPLLLCSQIIGVPARDLGGGVLRSASNSVTKALQVMVYKLLSIHPAASVMSAPAAVTQLVHMTSSGNPMAIAVNGIDFLGFEQIGVSVDGGPMVQATLDDELLMSEPSDATLRVDTTNTPPPRFTAGTHVLVYGVDGLWHAATVHQFRDGRYEVALDGMSSGTWVDPARVRLPT
ncbi:MAG TPA: hypothetical protein VNM90_17995 [Haliangium sp.]|nr:hypothetical protein [Haliangium sp.]